MVRKFLFAVLFVGAIAPAIADECPVGYGYKTLVDATVGGCVDLGTLNWTYQSGYQYFNSTSLAGIVKSSSNWLEKAHLYCTLYTSTYPDDIYGSSGTHSNNLITATPAGAIGITNHNYTDSTSFKQAMSGVILYYQRATDESWILPSENAVCQFDTSSYNLYGQYVLPEVSACTLCPPNTYKDFVGNEACSPCPDKTMSPAGATSVDECVRIMYVGGKIYPLNSVKKTSPSLNVMGSDGKIWYGNLYSEK